VRECTQRCVHVRPQLFGVHRELLLSSGSDTGL
jgi:hypothetical protein